VSTVIQRRELSTVLLITGVAAIVALVYADTFASLASGWAYQDYSHGMLVFPISAYLLWRLRSPLANIDLKPWPWGVAIMAGLVLLWLVSRLVGVQAGEHLTAVLLMPAAVATCLGVAVARRALFPLLFLAAAVPVGDSLIPYLMEITADVSSWLLRVVGVPVYREGQFLSLPGGEFEVAEVCSGLRSLVAGTTIALLFAYLTFRSNARRALFVGIAAVTFVVVNALRAFIVMYVASATDMRVLAGVDHIYFGWALFGVAMGALLWYGVRFSDLPADEPRAPAPRGEARASSTLPMVLVLGLVMLAVTAQPFRQDVHNVWWVLPAGAVLLWAVSRFISPAARSTTGAVRPAAGAYLKLGATSIVVAAIGLTIAGPLVLGRSAGGGAPAQAELVLPEAAGCGRAEGWLGGWRPEWPSPDFGVTGSYRCSGELVNVFVAGYRSTTQGRELVGESNAVYPDRWRQYVVQDSASFAAASGRRAVRELRVDGAGQRSLIWYWYEVGDRSVTDPVAVKLAQVLELLTSGRTDGAIYWLETSLAPGIETARERLTFVARDVSSARAGSADGIGRRAQ
jgi:exosortase A